MEGCRLTNRRVFAEITPGVADGFRVDTEGNIWTSAADGVQCYAPDGELIGKIHFPEVVTNLTFGGRKRIASLPQPLFALLRLRRPERGAAALRRVREA